MNDDLFKKFVGSMNIETGEEDTHDQSNSGICKTCNEQKDDLCSCGDCQDCHKSPIEMVMEMDRESAAVFILDMIISQGNTVGLAAASFIGMFRGDEELLKMSKMSKMSNDVEELMKHCVKILLDWVRSNDE